MSTITFNHYGKQFTLSEENCTALFNDEENPIEGFGIEDILNALSPEILDFDTEYFDSRCENCSDENSPKLKAYPFLEFHFYAFAKENKYIMNSLSKEYEPLSYETMERQGKVDGMYLVSLILCESCGSFSAEIELVD